MRGVVSTAFHSTVDQVGTAAGNDLTAAHVHGDAHHAVGGHSAGGRDNGGNLSPPRLGVEIGASAALSVQLGVWVVRVCSATEDRRVCARESHIQMFYFMFSLLKEMNNLSFNLQITVKCMTKKY